VRGLLKEETVAGAKKQTEPVVFEVVVSFDALDVGERFTQQPDDMGWALMHVENGYLRVVEEAPDAGEVSTG
jgi:hypothetical protein